MADTTANINLPLRWDLYSTDRRLVEVALERIDAAFADLESGGGDPVEVLAENVDVNVLNEGFGDWTNAQGAFDVLMAFFNDPEFTDDLNVVGDLTAGYLNVASVFEVHEAGTVSITSANGEININGALPTEDPEINGRVWLNAGVMTVSAGAV